MNVGLYFDLRNPPEWQQSWPRVYGFALEMMEEAERLGCHSAWFAEHHRFADGYLPQPLTMAAAVAARTQSMRIGTAVVLAPFRSARHIAEEAAVVDILSGGRLELGLGAGYRSLEFELFGVDRSTRYDLTDERIREIRVALETGEIRPSPVQPELPIWAGYQGPMGARRAGRLGVGLLTPHGRVWGEYREGLIEGGHDVAATARMAGPIDGWITHDFDLEWPILERYYFYQIDSYRRHAVEGTRHVQPPPVNVGRMLNRESRRPLSALFVGPAASVAGHIWREVGDAPVETVFLWASVGGMPDDLVASNVSRICTELAPLLSADPAVAKHGPDR